MNTTTTPRALPSQRLIDASANDGRRLAEQIRDSGDAGYRKLAIDMAHKRSDSQLVTTRAWAHAVLAVFGETP